MTVGEQPFTEPAAPDVDSVNPVDVRLVADVTETERHAPDFGSSQNVVLQLAGQAQPVQLLQRREKRSKARILIQSLGGASPAAQPTIGAFGNVANPGANAVLATTVVAQAGFYAVNWAIILAGTLTTADRSNVVLQVNGVTVATAINGLNVGTYYPQSTVQVSIPAGATVQLLIPVANAAAVYTGNFTLTPLGTVGAASAALFHNRPDVLANPNPPSGVGIQIITAPSQFDWESQQPLYGVGIGGLVTVSVIDETYE